MSEGVTSVTPRHMSRSVRSHLSVTSVTQPFRGVTSVTVTLDLVPMPGFSWVGGYGGRGCLVALCRKGDRP